MYTRAAEVASSGTVGVVGQSRRDDVDADKADGASSVDDTDIVLELKTSCSFSAVLPDYIVARDAGRFALRSHILGRGSRAGAVESAFQL